MHDLDAVLAGLDRPVHRQLAAFHPQRAMGRAKIAGDDLDQSGLAGTVVAHQSDDLAGLERQRNVVERVNGPEMLRNIFQFEKSHSFAAAAMPFCCVKINRGPRRRMSNH